MNALLIASLGLLTVIFCIVALRMHAFLSLLLAALVTGLLTNSSQLYEYGLHSGMTETAALAFSQQSIGSRLGQGLGSTTGKIGILIALASIIGMALMKSGAAERIVRGLLGLVGKKRTGLALISSSFTLGIPVFFDTVFYLLIPIVKSASIRNPAKYSFYLMCAIAGGVMTHSLVPPTPGPLYVAKELNVDIGFMMLGGIVVGALTVAAGYFYALWANKKWPLEMRDTPDVSIEDLKGSVSASTTELPGLGWSFLPILLPIILISGATLLGTFLDSEQSSTWRLFSIIGESNIALLISALIALLLLWKRSKDIKTFEKNVSESLSSAGTIILITGAGGAFGQMLQQTDIGSLLGRTAESFQVAILPLAFFITMAVRTAQGSATVAMVTTIGVMSGMANTGGFGFHPIYLALVIGCGSKIFPWMNDSAFWIITKMSGMETIESIRFFSFLLTVMGFAGLFFCMLLAYFFPFV